MYWLNLGKNYLILWIYGMICAFFSENEMQKIATTLPCYGLDTIDVIFDCME